MYGCYSKSPLFYIQLPFYVSPLPRIGPERKLNKYKRDSCHCWKATLGDKYIVFHHTSDYDWAIKGYSCFLSSSTFVLVSFRSGSDSPFAKTFEKWKKTITYKENINHWNLFLRRFCRRQRSQSNAKRN